MSNTPKLEDPGWGTKLLVGVFMLIAMCVTPFLFHLNGGSDAGAQQSMELGHSPLDKLIRIGTAAKAVVEAWWAPVLTGFGISAVLTVAAVLAVRDGRALMQVTVRAWWVYRRRWARTLDAHGLLVKHGDKVKVPRLGKIRVLSAHNLDVMQVRMPQGQDVDDWQQMAPRLALAFGATAGHVEPDTSGGKKNPYKDIVVAFSYGRDGHTLPGALPSPREMAALPMIPDYPRPKPVVIRISARALILGWGSIQIDDGQTIRRVRLWSRRWDRCLTLPVT